MTACPWPTCNREDLVERLARELTHQRGYQWETLGVYGQIHWHDEARKVLALPTVAAALRLQGELT